MIEKKSMKLDSQKSESLTDILSMAEKELETEYVNYEKNEERLYLKY